MVLKILAFISLFSAIFILTVTIYPIVSYEILSREKFPRLLSPLVESSLLPSQESDSLKASNWFVGARGEDFSVSKVNYYTLSIPKLKIASATVAIGGEDLSENLIHYPGTSIPGKNGNAVIFGHSVLPRFYNPKEYISIFSLLPTLEKGDEIKVNFDGITYLYKVEEMFEVLPTDIQVLEQNYSDSFLTLVTCTPPGDPRRPKRLIVRARIVPFEKNYANLGS